MKVRCPSLGIFGLALAVLFTGPALASDADNASTASWQVIAGDYSDVSKRSGLELLTPETRRKKQQSASPILAADTDDSAAADQNEARVNNGAEKAVPDPDTVVELLADNAVEELAEAGRYALLKLDGEVLRIDREAGTVSSCSKRNELWRCMPAPLAEDAYLAEIDALNAQIEALNAQIEELQSAALTQKPEDPAVPDTPNTEQGSAEGEYQPNDGDAAQKDGSRLSKSEEEELEEILDFTETAMRRFFGLMQELRSDFQSGSPSP